MKIKSVKGTRDFYPPEMAVHNFILDGWKATSQRNGFEEYEGPIFEYLKMYQVKSGDEIVEQLFNFTDRGDRHLAIRPEITPTLARMVNQQINALPRPIKWFSLPRMCRAERPQKGRLREFWQWNIDIIGIDDVVADAEVIFTAVDYLRSTGLTSDDIQAKISSRRLLACLLEHVGIEEGNLTAMYALLDKKAKLPAEAFAEALAKQVPDEATAGTITKLMEAGSIDEIAGIVELGDDGQKALDEIRQLFGILESMGIADFCTFDMSIVRGLAYYTGIVFEVHDVVGQLRAVCGGGRYDNLLADFGGPKVSATGMGMGDCVLEILLEEKGLLKDKPATRQLDYYIAYTDGQLQNDAIALAARLRTAGKKADFSYKAGSLKKQLKAASSANAEKCVILAQEYIDQELLIVKDMQQGTQENISADKLPGF